MSGLSSGWCSGWFFTRLAVRGAAVALLGLVAACGDSPAGPSPVASAIRIEAGNQQEGVAGEPLPVRVAVSVLDASGRPLSNARVTFNAAPGAGSITPAAVQTNADGRAEGQWVLGTTAGFAVATANVSGTNGVTFIATVLPGPASQVVAVPGAASLGVGDTLRLRAIARDMFGNSLPAEALAWSALDPSIATVASNGLLTALSQGTARATVTSSEASGSIVDTVLVDVGPPGTSACGSRTSVVPAIGEVVLLEPGPDGAVRCVGATVAGAEYAMVVLNASPDFGQLLLLDALALGVGPGPGTTAVFPQWSGASLASATPALAAAQSGSGLSTNGASAFATRNDGGFERALRHRERTQLPALAPVAREMFGASADKRFETTGGGQTNSTGILAAQVQPPAVGSSITINAQVLSACSQASNRTGRVVAVSERAIVVADNENPSGGYTDAEYEEIATRFDTLTYPLDVEYFGEPTNVSGTGRITLFYTSAVNQLTPANAGFVVGGFFFARDLYPKTARNGLPACAGSNEREIMYLVVADPNGEVNGNRRTKEDVTRLNRTTVAHELQHLINAGRRLLVTPGAVLSEETWLDEGLAHTAEELLYFRSAGFTSRENLDRQAVAPNPDEAAVFTAFAAQNFARFSNYLQAPSLQSPYAPNDSLSTRGAAWHLLRFVAGRQPGQEAAFYRKLVAGPSVGVANFTAALPSGTFTSWLREWSVSLFADDLVEGLDPIYQLPAWDFRSIMPVLRVGGGTLGVYPLATSTMSSNSPRRTPLAGGGTRYFRFSVPEAGEALLSVSSNGQSPPDNVQIAIVRYR